MNPYTENSILGDSFLDSKYFNPDFWYTHGGSFFQGIYHFIFEGSLFRNILVGFSIFFITIIAYCFIRLLEIRRKEKKHLAREIAEYAHRQAEREKRLQEEGGVSKNERWRKVLTYIFSINSADWKLAIIEADSMLEGLMEELGFRGENLGEKLKSANQETFRPLSAAWEAHTVRNKIAHEGLGYDISQHEAKRIVALYEQIFREFGYI